MAARLAASPLAPGAAFLGCTLIWGSTWLAIKVGYAGVGPLTGAALRFGLAAALLALAMVALRWPWPGRAAMRIAVLQAVLMFLLDYGLIYWAEQSIDSGLTAVLFAVFPLFAAMLAHAMTPGERMTPRALGGGLLGIAGLGVVFAESLVFDPARLPAMAAVVAAAFFAALANVFAHRDGKGMHPATYTMPGMALGALLLIGAALATGERVGLPVGAVAWGSVLYLGAVGSALAFLAYFWLLQRWGPGKASLLILLTPLVALALGAALLGEQPGPGAGLGTLLVLAGVGVTVRAPRSPARAKPEPEPQPDAAPSR